MWIVFGPPADPIDWSIGLAGAVRISSWRRLHRVIHRARVLVVACPEPGLNCSFYRRLATIVQAHPEVPIVCVAPYDATHLNALAPLPLSGVVDPQAPLEELRRQVERFCTPDPGRALRHLALTTRTHRWPVSGFIRVLCDPDGPPWRTVESTLRYLGISDSAFRAIWLTVRGAPRPKLVLDWTLYLRALELWLARGRDLGGWPPWPLKWNSMRARSAGCREG